MSILSSIGSMVAQAAPIAATALGAGPIAGALIGAAGNAIGSGMQQSGNNITNYKNSIKLAQHQAAISDRQWKERFDMQNEYSSPSEQKKRLIEAGLNPNLAYGQGLSSGNIASSPSTTPVSGQLSKYYNASEHELANLQKAAMSAQIKKTEAEANEINTRSENNQVNTEYQQKVNSAFDAAIQELGYNPFKEQYLNNENVRAFNKYCESIGWATYGLEEQRVGLETDMSYKQYDINLKYLQHDLTRLGFEKKISNAQAYQLYQAGALAFQQGLLTKATTTGVYLDNGFKKANVSWANWNAAMDAAIKAKQNKITNEELKQTLVRTGIVQSELEYAKARENMPYVEMFDVVVGRLESVANTVINAKNPFSTYQPLQTTTIEHNYNSQGKLVGRKWKEVKQKKMKK